MFILNDSSVQYGENVSNFTNTTNTYSMDPALIFGPKRDSMYIVIPMTIMYTIIFVIGVIGNLCTCIVIIRNKSMHTATNYYLFSLAISDLLLLLSGMPQEMYSIWVKWPYAFGPTFCLIRGLAAETSTNASVLTITLFTIERYLAICHPFQSHKMSKLSRAIKHVILLWFVSTSLALPLALQFGITYHRGVAMCLQTRVIIQHSFEISTFVFFFAPMILITVLYSLIGLRLKRANVKKTNSMQKEFIEDNVTKTNKLSRRHTQSTRVVRMLVAVVVAFFLCWAPFHAQRLVAIYGTAANHSARSPGVLFVYSVLTYSSGVFYYVSTCINPILYHIMSNKFREAFKNTMLQWCRAREHGSARLCSYSPLALARQPTSSGTDNSGNSYRNETTGFYCNPRNASINKGNCLTHSQGLPVTNEISKILPMCAHERSHERYCPRHYFSRWYATKQDINISEGMRGFPAEVRPMEGIRYMGITRPEYNRRTVTRTNSNHDTISNSSLKEVKKEDLADELTSYVKEIQLRVLQRERDYG